MKELHGMLISHRDLEAEELPGIVKRIVYSAWLSDLFEHIPTLGQFRGQEHQKMISDFQQLERKLISMGPQRVVFNRSNLDSDQMSIQPGSEASVLYREAGKRKKLLPLRKLFREIPHLLTSLKPCLLMSPISVSQYLDTHINQFDLLIFDEASQICSEDAVGAIYRTKQLVVCGDNKQLPPTAFFQKDMLDEFTEDEGEQQFYGSRLVTFPSAFSSDPNLGVKFVHVEDGVYDRGGKCNMFLAN
jgi:hypothetical protein